MWTLDFCLNLEPSTSVVRAYAYLFCFFSVIPRCSAVTFFDKSLVVQEKGAFTQKELFLRRDPAVLWAEPEVERICPQLFYGNDYS